MRKSTELLSLVHPSCGQLRTTVTPVNVDGLAGEWHTAANADPDRRFLFLHGGGWMAGSLSSHRGLVSNLVAESGCVGLVLDYRLAPKHPFPAGLNDCVRAYRWLVEHGPAGPGRAAKTALVGDSAGGNLVLACLLSLRDGGQCPDAAVVMSPVTDLLAEGGTRDSEREVDVSVDAESLRPAAETYAHGHDLADPLLSPLRGDLAGFPPLLVQVGQHEVLRSDSERLAAAAATSGVEVTLEVWEKMPHVFQIFVPFLPEATDAVRHIADFLRAHA